MTKSHLHDHNKAVSLTLVLVYSSGASDSTLSMRAIASIDDVKIGGDAGGFQNCVVRQV